eukprot:m51a1_g4343 putative camp phosphodiesterase a (782) ;mRNA; f:193498-196223
MSASRRLRIKMGVLEGFIGIVAVVAVVTAVVVPWMMARNAGLTSVREVANPLVEKVVASARSEVLRLLSLAPQAGLEIADAQLKRGWLHPGNLSAEMEYFIDVGLRVSPQMRIKYIALGYLDGRMSCAWFEAPTRRVLLNTVQPVAGTAAHQYAWITDSATLWNSSYPSGGQDLGEYNLTELMDKPNIYGNPEPHWDEEVFADVTEAPGKTNVDLLVILLVPYFIDGKFFAALNVDLLLGTISEFLEQLDLSPSARVLVVDVGGTLIGNSHGEPVYKTGSDGLLTTIDVMELTDPMARAVALYITKSAANPHAPFYFASDTRFSLHDKFGLNWTTLVAVSESDYTDTLFRVSRNALFAGILIIVLTPFVIGAVFGVALRLMQKMSHKIYEAKSMQVNTGMDKVLATLKRMQSEKMSHKEIRQCVESVLHTMRSGLFRLDLNTQYLDKDVERWIRQEFCAPDRSQSGALPCAIEMATLESDDSAPIDSWSFDVLSQGSCFQRVAAAALRKVGAAAVLSVDEDRMALFLAKVEGMYRDNPYHNALHAADVTQATLYMVEHSGLGLSAVDSACMVLAAVVHDVGHPGRNNQFQTAARTQLAMRYNDSSVLENYHAATAFELMRELGVLEKLGDDAYRQVRRKVIALILATDMSVHFQVVSEFRSRTAGCGGRGPVDDEDARLACMKMLIKMADASNCARPLNQMLVWAQMVHEEFLQQGDEERARGLQVSAHMDRGSASLARLQQNFLKFIRMPMFQAYAEFQPIPEIMQNLHANEAYWNSVST